MSWVTAEDVRRAIDFPASGAPISDSDIEEFIIDAQEEIEDIYHTKFGNVEDSGTAESGDDSTITDTDKSWSADVFKDMVVWVDGGTGVGQYRYIISNDTDTLNISPNWSTNPDNTSTYKILTLGYKNESIDGTGTAEMIVDFQPLINLISLSIDSTSVTTSKVYQYLDSGKLILKDTAEVAAFKDNERQIVDLKYIYGVYDTKYGIPRIIKRLCVLLAGMRTLTAQIAGTYDDFTNVSLPGGVTGSKGEPYTNIRESVAKMQTEAKGIIFGDDSQAEGSGLRRYPSFRPFVNFG